MTQNYHPFFSDRRVVILLASFCCLLWGSAYPAIKSGYVMFNIAANDIPSKMLFAGYRFLFAGFLPNKDKARHDVLTELSAIRATLVCV